MNPGAAGIVQIQELITRLISISVALAFIIFSIVMVYAGIRFITSGGDPKSIAAASQAITWGFLGILFLVLAWLILILIEAFTGVPVSKTFCLGFPNGGVNVPGLNNCP